MSLELLLRRSLDPLHAPAFVGNEEVGFCPKRFRRRLSSYLTVDYSLFRATGDRHTRPGDTREGDNQRHTVSRPGAITDAGPQLPMRCTEGRANPAPWPVRC